MKLSQAAEKVISLATAIQEYWDRELPKRHADYPLVAPGEDSGPPPPEEEELREFLESLPTDDVYKLALLIYLWRGEFQTQDLAEGFESLKRQFPETQLLIARLVDKASLADDMTDGIAKLNDAGISLDDLSFASART